MVTTIDKEYIMNSMLESLRLNIKHYKDVKYRDLANIYIGELSGFEIFYNIVAARGTFVDETRKINEEFRNELESARKILADKFTSSMLQ